MYQFELVRGVAEATPKFKELEGGNISEEAENEKWGGQPSPRLRPASGAYIYVVLFDLGSTPSGKKRVGWPSFAKATDDVSPMVQSSATPSGGLWGG